MSSTQKTMYLSVLSFMLIGMTFAATTLEQTRITATQNPIDPIKSLGEYEVVPDAIPPLPQMSSTNIEYCVVFGTDNEENEDERKETCFDTLDKAAQFVTDNTGANKDSVILAMQGQDVIGGAIIGIEYKGTNYTGSILYISATTSGGCHDGTWYLPVMPYSWNDSIYSAFATGGCTDNTHYSLNFYSGSQHICSQFCPTMDLMAGNSSSIKMERK